MFEPYNLALPVAARATDPNESTTLLVGPAGYLIWDPVTGAETPLTWNDRFDGVQITWDCFDDGCWPAAIESVRGSVDGYRVYWVYPFSNQVHVWEVNKAGNRTTGHDLSQDEAHKFLSSKTLSRSVSVPRMVRGMIELQENDRAQSFVSGLGERLVLDDPELCFVIETSGEIFGEPWIDTARRGLRNAERQSRPDLYRNIACYASRFGPIVNLINRITEEKVSGGLGLMRCGYASHVRKLPSRLRCRFPSFQLDDLREKVVGHVSHDDEAIVFSFYAESAPRLNIHISQNAQLSPRAAFAISYLNHAIISLERLIDRPAQAEPGLGVGVMLAHDTPPTGRLPSVAFQRRRGDERTNLIPDLHFFMSVGYQATRQFVTSSTLDWKDRRSVFFWRGTTTGGLGLTVERALQLPRTRLCEMTKAVGRIADCRISGVVQAVTAEEEKRIKTALVSRGIIGDHVPQKRMAEYKYLIDIDGNANAWSLVEKLMYGSCVVKVSSNWEQWFYPRMQPWVHFVPVAENLSDLLEVIEWCVSHTAECEQIAHQGRELARGLTFDTEMNAAAMTIYNSLHWGHRSTG